MVKGSTLRAEDVEEGTLSRPTLDEERTCVLVLIGATEDGTKELLAVVDGYRENTHPGVKCLGSSNAWVSQRRRSSRSVTGSPAFGSL